MAAKKTNNSGKDNTGTVLGWLAVAAGIYFAYAFLTKRTVNAATTAGGAPVPGAGGGLNPFSQQPQQKPGSATGGGGAGSGGGGNALGGGSPVNPLSWLSAFTQQDRALAGQSIDTSYLNQIDQQGVDAQLQPLQFFDVSQLATPTYAYDSYASNPDYASIDTSSYDTGYIDSISAPSDPGLFDVSQLSYAPTDTSTIDTTSYDPGYISYENNGSADFNAFTYS